MIDLATKVTRVFSRPDGSEVKIVAQTMFGVGLAPSTDVTVFRRANPGQSWHLCNDRPHVNWREMSVDEYVKHGRPEALQAATHGEILGVIAMLGHPVSVINAGVGGTDGR